MKKILLISFSPIKTDPRVMRQIDALKNSYDLTIVGFGESPCKSIEFFNVDCATHSFPHKIYEGTLLFFRFFNFFYWKKPYVRSALTQLLGRKFDCVISNDIDSLPLALRLAGSSPVYYDAHEYSPKEFEDRFIWRLFYSRYYYFLCETYLSKAKFMTTVCSGIADEYKKNFNVHPEVVLNTPEYEDLLPSPTSMDSIRLIHHGIAASSRSLELMIYMMQHLDERFTLDLMLVDNGTGYLTELKNLAKSNSRIRFRPPVEMKKIASEINNYDIGIFLLPPVNFNYKHALPNKFFEFIQARLAVAIGPSVEMVKLANEYGFGVIANDFSPETMAAELSSLSTEKILLMKNSSNKIASQFNADVTKTTILNTIKTLLAAHDKC